jgi:hypothetical protein
VHRARGRGLRRRAGRPRRRSNTPRNRGANTAADVAHAGGRSSTAVRYRRTGRNRDSGGRKPGEPALRNGVEHALRHSVQHALRHRDSRATEAATTPPPTSTQQPAVTATTTPTLTPTSTPSAGATDPLNAGPRRRRARRSQRRRGEHHRRRRRSGRRHCRIDATVAAARESAERWRTSAIDAYSRARLIDDLTALDFKDDLQAIAARARYGFRGWPLEETTSGKTKTAMISP